MEDGRLVVTDTVTDACGRATTTLASLVSSNTNGVWHCFIAAILRTQLRREASVSHAASRACRLS